MRLGAAWMLLAVAVTGLPPLSGFLGKLMLLQAAPPTAWGAAIWAVFILSGFVGALAMARAASTVFWERTELPPVAVPGGGRAAVAALLLALALVPMLVVAAAPLAGHARGTAEQLVAPEGYARAVLPDGVPARERRP
jgi:multicomponent K+:H+ antiporter subunit D